MARKIAIVLFAHECEESPCHINNASQESWIKERVGEVERLKWNWKLQSVRVVDLIGDDKISLGLSGDMGITSRTE